MSTVPADFCPNCGYMIDHASEMATGAEIMPKEKDFTLCLSCGHLFRFGPELKMVPATVEDVHALSKPDLLRILMAQKHIVKRGRLGSGISTKA